MFSAFVWQTYIHTKKEMKSYKLAEEAAVKHTSWIVDHQLLVLRWKPLFVWWASGWSAPPKMNSSKTKFLVLSSTHTAWQIHPPVIEYLWSLCDTIWPMDYRLSLVWKLMWLTSVGVYTFNCIALPMWRHPSTQWSATDYLACNISITSRLFCRHSTGCPLKKKHSSKHVFWHTSVYNHGLACPSLSLWHDDEYTWLYQQCTYHLRAVGHSLLFVPFTASDNVKSMQCFGFCETDLI